MTDPGLDTTPVPCKIPLLMSNNLLIIARWWWSPQQNAA